MEIVTFDTIEAMQTYLADCAAEADARVSDWQRRMAPGQCFLQRWETGPDVIWIYGEILDPGNDPEDAPLGECWRLVRSFSPLSPDGELGTMHISEIYVPLTREQFEQFRAADWPQSREERSAAQQ